MPSTIVVEKPAAIVVEKPVIAYRSSELERIQERFDSPFGMLFLKVPSISLSVPSFALTTSSSEETSNDGTSRLDPVYDEDQEDDSK